MQALFSIYERQQHPYQILPYSSYPFFVSFTLFVIVLLSVGIFHDAFNENSFLFYHFTPRWLLVNFIYQLIAWIFFWGFALFSESFYAHTFAVQRNLRYGAIWFIISEICFFLTFFGSFFYLSLEPRIWIGCVWPPLGIEPVSMWNLSLYNTFVLLTSGVFLMWAHSALLCGDWNGVFGGILGLLSLSSIFLSLQAFEYYILTFGINDSVYGSFFYLLTGFHGFHVFLGTVAFIFCFIWHLNNNIYQDQYVFFECSAWYWHFVDVVWFFVYLNFYVWGSWGA